MSVEEAYETVCMAISDTLSFSLKLCTSETPLSIPEILSFVKLGISSENLENAWNSRKSRAISRTSGFRHLAQLYTSVSFISVKQDLIGNLATSLRKTPENHFLYHVIGSGTKFQGEVVSAFRELEEILVSNLNSGNSDFRLQNLIMGALSLEFSEKDISLLRETNFLRNLREISAGDGQVWTLLNRPSMVGDTSIDRCQVVIPGCIPTGKVTGPIVPAKMDHVGGDFTLSLWIYPVPDRSQLSMSSSSTWRTIVLKGSEEVENRSRAPGLFFSVEDKTLALCVSTASNWNVCLRSHSEISMDTWTHVTCTCSNLELNLYLNGVKDASMFLNEDIVYNSHSFYVGKTPGNFNEKPGMSGFVESVLFSDISVDEATIFKLKSKEPLPPENEHKDKQTRRKLQGISAALLNMLSLKISSWNSQLPETVELQDEIFQTLLAEFKLKIRQLQGFEEVSEANENIRKKRKTQENPEDAETKEKWNDDHRCFEILVLLYRLKDTLPGSRFFSQWEVIDGLTWEISLGTPRIQRIIFRILRWALPKMAPTQISKIQVVNFILNLAGNHFVPEPEMGLSRPNTPSQSSQDQLEKMPEWVVMIHRWDGLSAEECCRNLTKAIGKEALGVSKDNFAVAQGAAIEAQEIGRAVIKTGTREECETLANRLAKYGFIVKLIESVRSSGNVPNLKLEVENPVKWKSGQTSFSTCAESVMLLRTLWKTDSWNQLIRDTVMSHVINMSKVVMGTTPISEIRPIVASLCIIGGFTDSLRTGAKAEISGNSGKHMGKIVNYDRMTGNVDVVHDEDSQKIISTTPDHCDVISEVEFQVENFPLVSELIPSFLPFINDLPAHLQLENPRIFSILKSMAMKSFAHMLTNPNSVEIWTKYEESQKSSEQTCLIEVASALGDFKMNSLEKYLKKERRLLQRLYEIDCHENFNFQVENSTSTSEVEEGQSHKLPFNPFVTSTETFPTGLNFQGKEVHHVIVNSEREFLFLGSESDELMICADAIIPDVVSFYFEVKFDVINGTGVPASPLRDSQDSNSSQSQLSQSQDSEPPTPPPPPSLTSKRIPISASIGLCPPTGLPAWSNGCYGYHALHNKSHKSSIGNRELFLALPRFTCPFCNQEDLTEREISLHVPRRHGNASRRAVCPICAASPFGNPNYVSQDLLGHLKDKHRARGIPDPCPPTYEKYGSIFYAGDTVGCGWNRDEDTVYFTLNGKFLGIAFLGVEGSFFPMISVRSPEMSATVNFGQDPFVFDVGSENNMSQIRQEEQAMKFKLKEDLEIQRANERENQSSKLAARRVSAEMLQGFVGFHIKYCMVALEKTNDNVEMAAEWAMSHFEALSVDSPELFVDDEVPSNSQENPESVQPMEIDENRSRDNLDDSMNFNLGYSYTLPDFPENSQNRNSQKTMDVDSLKFGDHLSVVENPAKTNWVSAMEKTECRIGVVTSIDKLCMTAVMRFYYDDKCMYEDWCFPIRSLEIPPKFRIPNLPEVQVMQVNQLENSLVEVQEKISRIYICKAALNTIIKSPRDPILNLGNSTRLSQFFKLVSREYLSSPFLDLTVAPPAGSQLEILEFKLKNLCVAVQSNPNVSEVILQEAFKLLSSSSSWIRNSQVEESKHPIPMGIHKDFVKRIEIKGSNALFITFDVKCQMSPLDTLTFYADENCSEFLETVSHEKSGGNFSPIVIPGTKCFMKIHQSKETKGKDWGYRFLVSPSTPDFNMAIWILEFLFRENSSKSLVPKIKNFFSRTFKTLFHYLYTFNLPVSLKVIIVRMLTRILGVSGIQPDDVRSSDPRKMRETMKQEMETLITSTSRDELSSPYLQSLAELMVEMRRNMGNSVEIPPSGYRNMSLFDKLFEASQLVRCFNLKMSLPIHLITEAVRNVDQKPSEQTFLKLVSEKVTIQNCSKAFKILFSRFDLDADGFWNFDEISNFQLSLGIPKFEAEQFLVFLGNLGENSDRLSFSGFLNWQQREIDLDKAGVCKTLRNFGFNSQLEISINEISDPKIAQEFQEKWSRDMDIQLVDFINNMSNRTGVDVLQFSPYLITISESERELYPLLAKFSNSEIQIRFSILKILNSVILSALPLVDLSLTNVHASSLGHQLSQIRDLIFYDVKVGFMREILEKSVTDAEPILIYLDRLDAAKQLEGEKENLNCVFMQSLQQLQQVNPKLLRQKERSFNVVFKGENAEGYVGPYRESINQMCLELQSPTLPILIPCPNQQLARDTIGVGENREKFILNPAAKSSEYFNMLKFLGKLMGISIRSQNPLNLDLPSFFWKPVVGLQVEKRDLKEIDFSEIESLEKIEEMSQTEFSGAIFENFTTMLSDRKSEIPLKENGSEIPVTYESRLEFIKLKLEKRLEESECQMSYILEGLGTMLPRSLMSLFTWKDCRYLICANPEVDLSLLKRHTLYRGGVKPSDPHILNFWEILHEFSPAEKNFIYPVRLGQKSPPARK
eukprot:TRINITY_DN1308_c1_g1_i2.p1 TRINITY_DN1308_c1_g1~~TRINITY_DN1308_c1_g1_i2.p1  ORF type:complete len:2755 (-),score=1130.06 TRINITY_DN1308_c1_g1_i2:303-7640(-)